MVGEWLLLINTLYNSFLLTFASQITQTALTSQRKWLTAFMSSFVGLLLFPSIVSSFISFLILWTAFSPAKWKHAVLLFLGTFLIGGLLTALQAYASETLAMQWIWLLLTAFVLLYVVRFLRLRWQLMQKQFIVSCEIKMAQQRFVLTGFIDTGNICIEPMSALPVHFVALPAVQKQLPSDLVEAIHAGSSGRVGDYVLREIFLQTVHSQQVVIALQVEEMYINGQSLKEHYVVFIEQRPKFGERVDVILHHSILLSE